MAEQDRLAALLERATRERRGAAEDPAVPSDESAVAAGEVAAAEGEVVAADEALVAGGEWLPPDPGRHRPGRARPAVVTVPQSLRSLTFSVRPVAVVALLVVALVAAGIFGLRWWRAEQGSTPVPVAPQASELSPAPGGDGVTSTAAGQGTVPAWTGVSGEEPLDGSGPGRPTGPPTGPPTAAPPQLVVHVAGEVRHAGVVRLEPGARVQDAVDAAGGLVDSADTSRLNLARTVHDGERIWVPSPGEDVPEVPDAAGVGPSGSPAGPPGLPGDEGGVEQQININTADQAVLEELPGVGPVTAGAIVAWREENGGFSTPDELLEVSGIGEATLDKLRPHVTL